MMRAAVAAAVSGAPASQGGGEVPGGDLYAGGYALADRDERPPVRLARGQPAKHAPDLKGSKVITLR